MDSYFQLKDQQKLQNDQLKKSFQIGLKSWSITTNNKKNRRQSKSKAFYS